MAIVTQASYLNVYHDTNKLVSYNPDGSLKEAKMQVEAKYDSPPYLIIPIKQPISVTIQRSEYLKTDDLYKKCLIYRKETKAYMDNYGSIRRSYVYEIDLEHAFKYLGYVMKERGSQC